MATGNDTAKGLETDVAKDNRRKKYSLYQKSLRDCIIFLTGCWVFLMTAVFPLYFGNRYEEIGGYKYMFFSFVSHIFLIPAAVFFVSMLILYGMGEGFSKLRRLKSRISVLDLAVFAYVTAAALSYAFSDFPDAAWKGVSGWYMGLKAQILFALIYVLVSRFFIWKKWILYGHFLGSGLTFLLGILHRFNVDPLGMYEGLDQFQKLEFLSTIGQASWYSSYVCTVLPLGVCVFWLSKERRMRVWTGLYCALGFMTLAMQNSDSAFIALFLIFFGLFLFSLEEAGRLERFLQIVILCGLSWKGIGFLQNIFSERATQLGTLSTEATQGPVSWGILFAAALCYILLLRFQEKRGADAQERLERAAKKVTIAAVGIVAAGTAAAVLIIVLNTNGSLERWFGFTSGSQYLLFNKQWGNSRGFTWQFSRDLFEGLPWLRKLFGVGPDCFYSYSYSIPEYAAHLRSYWGQNALTNAHNEFLNILICMGLVGLTAFLSVFAAGLRRFACLCREKPFVALGALCLLSYAGHNIFCYQQVCCTPFLFLFLGFSENWARQKKDA